MRLLCLALVPSVVLSTILFIAPVQANFSTTHEWVEMTGSLPITDNITTATYGAGADEIWVGTSAGEIWLTKNGGITYQQVYRPISSEPIVEPVGKNLRISTPRNFGRGRGAGEAGQSVRDRFSKSRQGADLSGSGRRRQRDQSTPLLSSLTRTTARDRFYIKHIKFCHEMQFVATGEGLFRSTDHGVTYQRLSLGDIGAEPEVYWVICDSTRPGRVGINSAEGIFLSDNYGDAFYRLPTLFRRGNKPSTAAVDGKGRLLMLYGRSVYRERLPDDPKGIGFNNVCRFIGDSINSNRIRWSWLLEDSARAFAVTHDGVLQCYNGVITRLGDSVSTRLPIAYFFIDQVVNDYNHMLIATRETIFESFDGGNNFKQIWHATTSRAIKRIIRHPERHGDIIVVTGGQLFRRVAVSSIKPTIAPAILGREVALEDILQVALQRFSLTPAMINTRRTELSLRALLPTIEAGLSVNNLLTNSRWHDYGVDAADVRSQTLGQQNIWGVFAWWDLSQLWHDPLQTNGSWVDLEHLRRRLSYRIQDTFLIWQRVTEALKSNLLSPQEQLHYILTQRQAAAYLDHITGHTFAVFTVD